MSLASDAIQDGVQNVVTPSPEDSLSLSSQEGKRILAG